MLVITRKAGESIIIELDGKKVEIDVIETSKDKVKLGVEAPRDVKIVRSELMAAESSNMEASQAVSKNALEALIGCPKQTNNSNKK
jgi:carbon storage regulator